mmetsp:Transcript_18241/g.45207  ORF Transcript_18241/g.45207 Transcript_18241/m.45207 type:complete len:81 (-) Transcript_18241:634-876(-)
MHLPSCRIKQQRTPMMQLQQATNQLARKLSGCHFRRYFRGAITRLEWVGFRGTHVVTLGLIFLARLTMDGHKSKTFRTQN